MRHGSAEFMILSPTLTHYGDPNPALRAGTTRRSASHHAVGDVDVVFPVLHGAYGEDGTIQGLLEMAGIPYVGASVFASAAAMDKEFTKKLAVAEGIPTGPYVALRAGQSLTAEHRRLLGLPVFVKP